jgi:hypothetical protein
MPDFADIALSAAMVVGPVVGYIDQVCVRNIKLRMYAVLTISIKTVLVDKKKTIKCWIQSSDMRHSIICEVKGACSSI